MESDVECCEQCEIDDDMDWQKKFLQLRKDQAQLEDHATEIEAKMWTNEEKRKKEEEWKLSTEKIVCFNKHHNCYNNLILEEKKHAEEENNIVTK